LLRAIFLSNGVTTLNFDIDLVKCFAMSNVFLTKFSGIGPIYLLEVSTDIVIC
jgi:hypothetical protein